MKIITSCALFIVSLASATFASTDMVIVCPSAFQEEFEPLATHRIKGGLFTQIVTYESIQAAYPVSPANPATSVREFIKDYYANHGTQYVLLGADVSLIPTRLASTEWMAWDAPGGMSSHSADVYYACLDGTWNLDGDQYFGEWQTDDVDLEPEVYVGRVPAVTEAQVTTYVNKVLSYEHTSPNSDYQDEVLLLGSFSWYKGDGAVSCDLIESRLPTTLESFKLYQWIGSSPGPENRQTVLASLNAGCNIVVNYSQAPVAGDAFYARYEPGVAQELIVNADIDALANTNRYFIMYNVTCNNSNLQGDCVGAHMLRSAAGGAVAHIGTSTLESGTLTRPMAVKFFDELFAPERPRLGKALSLSRDTLYGAAAARGGPFHTPLTGYTLLGDPALAVWAKTPGAMQLLDVDNQVFVGQHTFVWTVWDPQSLAVVQGATVTFYKPNDCYVVSTSDQFGDVTLQVNIGSVGPAYITASKADFLANEINRTVTSCPVAMTGDVNLNGAITSSDIQYLVNYVFSGGPAPLPCAASGDVNRSATVTSGDITDLVAYVFKGGPAPLDVCPLIEQGTWSCP